MSHPAAKVPPWRRVTTVREEIASVLASILASMGQQ
jgi:hypothetical protein